MSVEPPTVTIKSQVFALNVTPPTSYPHKADLAVADGKDIYNPKPRQKSSDVGCFTLKHLRNALFSTIAPNWIYFCPYSIKGSYLEYQKPHSEDGH